MLPHASGFAQPQSLAHHASFSPCQSFGLLHSSRRRRHLTADVKKKVSARVERSGKQTRGILSMIQNETLLWIAERVVAEQAHQSDIYTVNCCFEVPSLPRPSLSRLKLMGDLKRSHYALRIGSPVGVSRMRPEAVTTSSLPPARASQLRRNSVAIRCIQVIYRISHDVSNRSVAVAENRDTLDKLCPAT